MARNQGKMRGELDHEIERLTREIDALENQRLALQRLRAKIMGETETAATPTRTRIRNVKDTVLGLLAEAGEKGLSVGEVIESAKARNMHLERGSVSSLLSRLKREGLLDLVGSAYRIKPRENGPLYAVQAH